ncbi:MAG: LCP family protein [Erysipelotrichaceae bacterium]
MKKKFKEARLYFILIYTLLTIGLVGQLILSNMIPFKYMAVVIPVLVLIYIGLFVLQYKPKISKVNRALGKVLIVFMCIFLLVGNLYLNKTTNLFGHIGGADGSLDVEVSIVVLKDSKAKDINDLKGLSFGEGTIGDISFNKNAIDDLSKDLNETIITTKYDNYSSFGDALYNGEVDAIILNEGMRQMFEDNHPNFNKETKVIKTYNYKSEAVTSTKSVDVTEESFIVYITGIDNYGDISRVGRSDVNKMAVVNPITKKILLIDVPRDYYVKQTCQDNLLDKLTHTGIFGPNCTVDSMSNFMGVDINYYVRVNFSGITNIVDALGGVDVHSEVGFTTDGGLYTYNAGMNHMNGASALAFARERYNVGGGDDGRIKNQTRVLEAIINKVTSTEVITNYMGFLDAIGGSFQTDMSDSDIKSLVKMQLDDMASWSISSYSLSGTGGTDWTPANGFNAYVSYPNMDTVTEAQRLITEIMNEK